MPRPETHLVFLTPTMQRAFTLLEILILLGIVLIVAAILFPVMSRPNHGSGRAICQSNLKLVGLGFLQYTQDYDGHFPFAHITPAVGWANAIYPYTKSTQILQCPRTESSVPQSTDYFYNRRLGGLNPKVVRFPARTILAGDGDNDAPMWSSIVRLHPDGLQLITPPRVVISTWPTTFLPTVT